MTEAAKHLKYILCNCAEVLPSLKWYWSLRALVFFFTAGWQSFNYAVIRYRSSLYFKQFISILFIMFKGLLHPDAKFPPLDKSMADIFLPGKAWQIFGGVVMPRQSTSQVVICLNCSSHKQQQWWLLGHGHSRKDFSTATVKTKTLSADILLRIRLQRILDADHLVYWWGR